MSHIKRKNTKSEVLVRCFLFANGYRFRLHRKDLPDKSDIVIPKYMVAIFISGRFWHGRRGFKFATIPVGNHDFWQTKISGNVERDKINIAKLHEMEWRVIEIWQCQLKPKNKELTLSNLLTELQNE